MKGLRTDLQLEEELLFGLRPAHSSRSMVAKSPSPSMPPTDPGLAGLRQQARQEPDRQFQALLHYVDVGLLKTAYQWLKEEGWQGVGGPTWITYGENLDRNTVALYVRLQRGRHRTLPPWRRALALARGRRRPLKRATLGDRIVQRAVAAVLEAVFEPDFAEPDRGFDRVNSQPQLLASLCADGGQEKLRWIVTADITRLRACIRAKLLLSYLQRRVGDARILDLIGRWLKIGLLDETVDAPGSTTVPVGALASVLMEVFCHQSFDVWAQRWRHRHARSPVALGRDPGHLIAVFEHKPAARRFQSDLRSRIKQCAPGLRPLEVRLIGWDPRDSGQLDEGDRPTLLMRTSDR